MGPRGKHPIYYIDFDAYKSIISNHWKEFKHYFSEVDNAQHWVLGITGDIRLSRNNVAHMGVLEEDDRQRILLNLRAWLKQIGT